MTNIEQILKEYGLKDHEIKVYLALLSIGSSKVSAISNKAGLIRTTTYEILKVLVEKGLVSFVIKSKVRYFEAADPNKFINILEEKKKKIKSILPELNSMKAFITEKPSIEVYEGQNGLKTILEDIIKTKPLELLEIGSAKIFEVLEFYFPHWIQKRVKAKIYAKILQEKTHIIQKFVRKNKSELREIRFLPKNFNINVHLQIYGDNVSILTLNKKELIGVIIKNKEIAEIQRSLFNFIWNNQK